MTCTGERPVDVRDDSEDRDSAEAADREDRRGGREGAAHLREREALPRAEAGTRKAAGPRGG